MSLPAINRVIPINQARERRRLRSFCDSVVRAIERHSIGTLVGIGVSAFLMAAVVASVRLLWFDELMTVYIAKTGSLRGIWLALKMGADPNPPLSSTVVMLSTRLFGDSEFAVRLPSIIAGTVTVACLFRFLNRRMSVVASAIGTLFFMSTRAFDYSYEARSYALTLCFCILSLSLWRTAVEGKHRIVACAGLSLSLALGISSNYFAVLAFFPIAAGEVVRAIVYKRRELRIWLALAFGGLPIVLYLPLVKGAVNRFAPYAWNKPNWFAVNESYNLLLDASLQIVFALCVAGASVYLYQRYCERKQMTPLFPAHELAAILILIAYPVLGYLLAVIRAGMFSPRFVLPMCFGIAIAAALSVERLFSRSSMAMLTVLVASGCWMLARNAYTASGLLEQREAFFHLQDALPQEGLLVVSDSLLALPLYHYSPPAIAERIVFPFNLKAIRKFKGDDSAEQNLWAGRSILPLKVELLDDIACSAPNCYIIAPGGNWLVRKLAFDANPAHQLAAYIDSAHLLERGFLFGMTFGGEVDLFGAPEHRHCGSDLLAFRLAAEEDESSTGTFKTRDTPHQPTTSGEMAEGISGYQ
jgi:hypothetical protein